MRITWYLHQKMYACHQASRGKVENPKLRVHGWCASNVRWCVSSVCLNKYKYLMKVIFKAVSI